jgi:hypothetical protein
MKNYDDPRHLAYKRAVDAERRAHALLKSAHRRRQTAAAMARMAGW